MKKIAITKLWSLASLTTILTSIIFLISAHPVIAANDDYLNALESESASEVRSGNNHDKAYFKNKKKMVDRLRTESPSTYKFYTKLTPKNKDRIFEQYSTDNSDTGGRSSRLQKHILDLYFKK